MVHVLPRVCHIRVHDYLYDIVWHFREMSRITLYPISLLHCLAWSSIGLHHRVFIGWLIFILTDLKRMHAIYAPQPERETQNCLNNYMKEI